MALPFSNTKLRTPPGFQNLLECIAREVLRSQPKDIISFAALHLEGLIQQRSGEIMSNLVLHELYRITVGMK